MLTVINSENRPFNVRLVLVGDRYGRDDCLIHGRTKWDNGADSSPLVEFYDASVDAKFGARGQFVSRYSLDSIASNVEKNQGIRLDGGVPCWFVTAENVREAVNWASAIVWATSSDHMEKSHAVPQPEDKTNNGAMIIAARKCYPMNDACPCYWVICRYQNEYVVWTYNNGDVFWGSYFQQDSAAAWAKFNAKAGY